MSVLGWILLGLIAGFIGSKIVNRTGQGFLLDIVLGIVGAVVGGFLFSAIAATGITGFNLYSMLVAVVGAVVVLWGYHAIAGRRYKPASGAGVDTQPSRPTKSPDKKRHRLKSPPPTYGL